MCVCVLCFVLYCSAVDSRCFFLSLLLTVWAEKTPQSVLLEPIIILRETERRLPFPTLQYQHGIAVEYSRTAIMVAFLVSAGELLSRLRCAEDAKKQNRERIILITFIIS